MRGKDVIGKARARGTGRQANVPRPQRAVLVRTGNGRVREREGES